ncbi:MAG: hypothetical protein AAB421_02520 [Patescibacteria group bacterium]
MKEKLSNYRTLALGTFLSAFALSYVPELAAAATDRFENPLRFQSIDAFIEGVLQAFVYIALPVVAFFFVLSGFKFLLATTTGDGKGVGEAKKYFMNVVIGSSLVLGAWALAVLIKGTVDQIRGV